MIGSKFVPSRVPPRFINSTFKRGESEALAAQIVTYLAQHGDAWDTPVPLYSFFDHCKVDHPGIPRVFQRPFENPIFAEYIVHAMCDFAEEGLIEHVGDEPTKFRVTQDLVQFYATYVH